MKNSESKCDFCGEKIIDPKLCNECSTEEMDLMSDLNYLYECCSKLIQVLNNHSRSQLPWEVAVSISDVIKAHESVEASLSKK